MNIFISTDDNYIKAAHVLLTSFFENNQKEIHNIYLMYRTLNKENLIDLKKRVESYGGNFFAKEIPQKEFALFQTDDRWTDTIYYRFLIPHLLPEQEERALWLDVDILVTGDISELYFQSFDGKYLIACEDMDNYKVRLQSLGCPQDTVYVNSGVLVYNVQLMRNYTVEDYYEYYCKIQNYIRYPDQDVINGLFAGKIKIVDYIIYNAQIYNSCENPVYSIENVREKTKIIHFVGKYKPWSTNYFHECGYMWEDYFLYTFKKSRIESFIYKWSRKPIRKLQEGIIYKLRVLHGFIHEKFFA